MGTERADVGGLLSQVKPTFMLPAVGMSVFGGLLSSTVDPVSGTLHALAVGSALYVAHLVDEYVDAHVRGEEAPQVPVDTVRHAVVAASAACLTFAGLVWARGQPVAAALVVPLLLLALLHAPLLDRHPVSVTADYPLGIALAVVGGYAAQGGSPSTVIGTAGVVALVLAGVKVSIDRVDIGFDRSVDKRTLPVLLGERRASHVSVALCALAGSVVVALVTLGTYPPWALTALVVLALVAWAGVDPSARRATRRQMVLVYPLVVVLFCSQCVVTDCVVWQSAEPFISGVRP